MIGGAYSTGMAAVIGFIDADCVDEQASQFFANAYWYPFPSGGKVFEGHIHQTRDECDTAAEESLRLEPKTRRVGVWHIRPK